MLRRSEAPAQQHFTGPPTDRAETPPPVQQTDVSSVHTPPAATTGAAYIGSMQACLGRALGPTGPHPCYEPPQVCKCTAGGSREQRHTQAAGRSHTGRREGRLRAGSSEGKAGKALECLVTACVCDLITAMDGDCTCRVHVPIYRRHVITHRHMHINSPSDSRARPPSAGGASFMSCFVAFGTFGQSYERTP